MKKPNIGDTVYIVVTRHNYKEKDKRQFEATVKKVGNKYFYTNNPINPHFDLAFEINNFIDGGWYEKPESDCFRNANEHRAYISREIYGKYQEKERILRILESDSMLDRPYKQIMAIAEILEVKFELEEWEK